MLYNLNISADSVKGGRNLEQVAIILCAQANSASYPQRGGNRLVAHLRGTVDGWGGGMSASCTMGLISS